MWKEMINDQLVIQKYYPKMIIKSLKAHQLQNIF